MLYEIMRYIRNFFPAPNGYHDGTYEITGGTIDLPFLSPGDYFLVEGSSRNDGVYQYPALDMRDETFTGTITELHPPLAFLDLVAEIKAYQLKSGAQGPYQSESFGGYSYTRATDKNGNAASWKNAFGSRLATWRKI